MFDFFADILGAIVEALLPPYGSKKQEKRQRDNDSEQNDG